MVVTIPNGPLGRIRPEKTIYSITSCPYPYTPTTAFQGFARSDVYAPSKDFLAKEYAVVLEVGIRIGSIETVVYSQIYRRDPAFSRDFSPTARDMINST